MKTSAVGVSFFKPPVPVRGAAVFINLPSADLFHSGEQLTTWWQH